MQLSLTYYSLGVTVSFCKFWFENDTLMQVRYCHLLGIWCVFIVGMLFLPLFFYSAYDKIDVEIYLKIFGCILVSYIYIRFNNVIIRNVSRPLLLHIKISSVSSKYRVEPESKKRNVNVFYWLSIVRNVIPSFLKCFLQFACTNLDGSQKEGVTF